jgi:cellulose synthase/poly-beta-1,6-N-acetylglucosamine synthase-like glycosyltransferase
MDRQYNGKRGAVNRIDGQTIQWQMSPSLWFIALHLSLYCLSISLIYCSSFVIVLSVHLIYLLLLICHCIVCPSLWFIAPHLSLYCLSISPIYCSSFAIVLSVHLSYLLLLICHCIVCPSLCFIVNRRDGQTIQWQMRSSKSERWIDNKMTNEEQ